MFCAFTRVFTVAFSSLLIIVVLLLTGCSNGQGFVITGNLESTSSSSSSTFSWPFDESEEARLPRSCSNKHFQTLMINACGQSSKRSVKQPQIPPILMNLLVVEYYFAPALPSSVHPHPPNMQHQQPPPASPQSDQQQPTSNHLNGWIPPSLSKNGDVMDIPLVIQQRTTASIPFHITPESVMMKMEPWLAPWVVEHHHSDGHGAGVILIMEAPPSSFGNLQHGLSSASLALMQEEFGGITWDLNEFREMLRRTPGKIEEVKRTYEMCCKDGDCEKRQKLHQFC